VAISQDGCAWFLLGASPDLRSQIEATPELHPPEGVRQSPISGVLLANADIDHVLGLLLLRELQPFRVHATASVRQILRDDNSMFAMLQRAENQVTWADFDTDREFSLRDTQGHDSDLICRAWSLCEHYPAYVPPSRRSQLVPSEASLAFFIAPKAENADHHPRFAYLPAVPAVDNLLLEQLESSDLLLFDGTFWSNDELIRVQGCGQTARQMGHIPVEETLVRLAGLRRPRKMFIHINNTNPMLNEASPQYRQVRSAGWEVAEDGWQFKL
jgi:pyrroloquinoline quinone biosynthesis protein B